MDKGTCDMCMYADNENGVLVCYRKMDETGELDTCKDYFGRHRLSVGRRARK